MNIFGFNVGCLKYAISVLMIFKTSVHLWACHKVRWECLFCESWCFQKSVHLNVQVKIPLFYLAVGSLIQYLFVLVSWRLKQRLQRKCLYEHPVRISTMCAEDKIMRKKRNSLTCSAVYIMSAKNKSSL